MGKYSYLAIALLQVGVGLLNIFSLVIHYINAQYGQAAVNLVALLNFCLAYIAIMAFVESKTRERQEFIDAFK